MIEHMCKLKVKTSFHFKPVYEQCRISSVMMGVVFYHMADVTTSADCLDGSDEMRCSPVYNVIVHCYHNYRYPTSMSVLNATLPLPEGPCILLRKVCGDAFDCPSAADEKNCKLAINVHVPD